MSVIAVRVRVQYGTSRICQSFDSWYVSAVPGGGGYLAIPYNLELAGRKTGRPLNGTWVRTDRFPSVIARDGSRNGSKTDAIRAVLMGNGTENVRFACRVMMNPCSHGTDGPGRHGSGTYLLTLVELKHGYGYIVTSASVPDRIPFRAGGHYGTVYGTVGEGVPKSNKASRYGC